MSKPPRTSQELHTDFIAGEDYTNLAEETIKRLVLAESDARALALHITRGGDLDPVILARGLAGICPNTNCVAGVERFTNGAAMTCFLCQGTGDHPDAPEISA